jgi:glyoxylase-like metal-dependent hydrolase (beta-lactamase superfamily II)
MKKILVLTVITLLLSSCLGTINLHKKEGVEFGKYGYFEFKQVNKNIYVMHGPIMDPSKENEGFMNNPAFIEGKHSLIVIDPGGSYNVGKKILRAIEQITKKPIVAVLNTHKHGDHWFANKALIEKYPKIKIYAHKNMINETKNGEAKKWYKILNRLTDNLKGTKPFTFPMITIKDKQNITIDGQTFKKK